MINIKFLSLKFLMFSFSSCKRCLGGRNCRINLFHVYPVRSELWINLFDVFATH